jgi:hypothetical protein
VAEFIFPVKVAETERGTKVDETSPGLKETLGLETGGEDKFLCCEVQRKFALEQPENTDATLANTVPVRIGAYVLLRRWVVMIRNALLLDYKAFFLFLKAAVYL